MNLAKEAATYFKREKGYNRLFLEFEKKYKSYERVGGKATLENPSLEEVKSIESVCGSKYKVSNGKIDVPLLGFQDCLLTTKFKVGLIDVLESYFGRPLVTNKEKKKASDEEKQLFFQDMCSEIMGNNSSIIYKKIINRETGTIGVHHLYQKDKKTLKRILPLLFKSVDAVPLNEPKRLPLFSTDITGNPHFFDLDSEAGRLFVSFLQCLLENDEVKEYNTNLDVEELTDTLNYYGLWRDDILNFVTCFGLKGIKTNGDVFKVMDAANEERTPYNLLLRDIFRLGRVEANHNCVFVVENSSLYSSLIDLFESNDHIPSIMCTHGQMRLSSVLLLTKLVESVDVIYYSGDHDPEGLQIAQRLVQRFGKKIKLWRFDASSYLSSLSSNAIDKTGEKKLEKIDTPELMEIKELILRNKKAGYQEKIFLDYVRDITDIVKKSNY